MPTKKYYLTEEEKDYIFLEWSGAFKNMTVKYNENVIGNIEGEKELKKGQEFEIDEGRKVQLKFSNPILPEIAISVNYIPLAGSPLDPGKIADRFSFIVYFIGGINILVGLISELLGETIQNILPFSYINIITGIGLLILGWFLKKGSINALLITIVFCIIDTLFLFVDAQSNPAVAFIIRVAIIAYLITGYKPLKENKKHITQAKKS